MISIVIVNYFSATTLVQGLTQLNGPAGEIIIIDNSVDPGERAVLELLASSREDVKVLFNDHNTGFAKGVNKGAGLATGDTLLLLNPDTLVHQGSLELLEASLTDGVGAVGPLIVSQDGTEQAGSRRRLPTLRNTLPRLLGVKTDNVNEAVAGGPLPTSPIWVEALSGACLLTPLALFKELGGLDETYVMHAEDLDYCKRLDQAGYARIFVPDARVTHVKGLSSRRHPVWVLWHLHRGMHIYFRKFVSPVCPPRYRRLLELLAKFALSARFLLLAPVVLFRQWRLKRQTLNS